MVTRVRRDSPLRQPGARPGQLTRETRAACLILKVRRRNPLPVAPESLAC